MRAAVTLCYLATIPVDIQVTWPPIFCLVTWSLSVRFFPEINPASSVAGHWAEGLLGSVLLFASLLAHELGHAFVARWRGLPVLRVSLFFLGGLAEVAVDEGTAGDELLMALAGPAVSIALAIAFFGAWYGTATSLSHLGSVALYLALSNLLLAAFNLLPGYPLDGGRLVRSLLWFLCRDQERATRWASLIGQTLGAIVGIAGVALVLAGDLLPGGWLAAVGTFLILAARGVILPALILSSPETAQADAPE